MSDKEKSGPAFPVMCDVSEDGYVNYHHPGMTLRDYFAIHASAEDIAPFIRKWDAQAVETNGSMNRLVPVKQQTPTAIARYAFADAMLKARQA